MADRNTPTPATRSGSSRPFRPKVRERAEVVAGGGAYSILKIDGRSVASVRDRNVRIVHPTDGSADSLKALAKLIADAAPEPKNEEPKGNAGAGE